MPINVLFFNPFSPQICQAKEDTITNPEKVDKTPNAKLAETYAHNTLKLIPDAKLDSKQDVVKNLLLNWNEIPTDTLIQKLSSLAENKNIDQETTQKFSAIIVELKSLENFSPEKSADKKDKLLINFLVIFQKLVKPWEK